MLKFEHFERGYLLPKGCKDLIDVIRLQESPETGVFPKLPLLLPIKPQTGGFLKPVAAPPPMKGDLLVRDHATVRELAVLLGQKPFKIIADLMELGVFANVNQPLGFEVISQVASKYGYVAKRSA